MADFVIWSFHSVCHNFNFFKLTSTPTAYLILIQHLTCAYFCLQETEKLRIPQRDSSRKGSWKPIAWDSPMKGIISRKGTLIPQRELETDRLGFSRERHHIETWVLLFRNTCRVYRTQSPLGISPWFIFYWVWIKKKNVWWLSTYSML